MGKKKNDSNSLTKAFTQAAVAISLALSPHLNSPATGTTCSPAKLIEARLKCYKQLLDLNNLKGSGVHTEDEYTDEKEAVPEEAKVIFVQLYFKWSASEWLPLHIYIYVIVTLLTTVWDIHECEN